MKYTWIILVFSLANSLMAQPTSAPTITDPKLLERLEQIDRRGASIKNMVADFQQEKITPLLRKPLVSKGTVRVAPDTMLWETTSPQPVLMHITASEASIYYPKEKLVEIYPVLGQLGQLAASPLPRLETLKKHFVFSEIPVSELDPSADAGKTVGLELTPLDPAVREHVSKIRVLLDSDRGFMIRFEMSDPDGERTLMRFANVQINTGLKESDLKLRVGSDVKTVRPLEKLQGVR